MDEAIWDYKGHKLELRGGDRAGEFRRGDDDASGQLELLIDGRPVSYGQLVDGSYFLSDNAYDWGPALGELAERYIDYRSRVEQIEGSRPTGEGS